MFEGKVVFNGEHKGKNLLIRYPTKDDTEKLLHYINTLSKEQTYIRLQGEQRPNGIKHKGALVDHILMCKLITSSHV